MAQRRFASLDELITIARHESATQMDYYIGVEHLLLALMRVEGGVAAHIFARQDASSSYVQFITQTQTSGSPDTAGYLGIPTPRAAKVIARAQSQIAKGMQPDERALLYAIVQERSSLVVKRVLENLGISREQLLADIIGWDAESAADFNLPPPEVFNSDPRYELLPDDLLIIQQIFRTCTRVVIERVLSSEGNSYSGARVLLVRAYEPGGREQAPSVVKLHDRRNVLWEKMRYNDYVRDKLPANTSHIMVDVLPENSLIGGLKYSFVQGSLDAQSTSLKDFALSQAPHVVARLLREKLYDAFKHTWWDQRTAYAFTAWQEYELLLPPALELEAAPEETPRSGARKITPLNEILRAEGALRYGELVVLNNFTVLKAKPERSNTVQFVAGGNAEAMNLASRVDVKNFDLTAHPNLHRGMMLEHVLGSVTRTRDDILQEQVLALAPDFDFTRDPLPYHQALMERLPNPLKHYRSLLEQRLSGSFCSMHGDLHVGNVLVGRNGEAWLIDFEWTRDGHTLFDWVTLEMSLLLELVVPDLTDSWEAVWDVIAVLDQLNRACYTEPHVASSALINPDLPFANALIPIAEVRRIASGLLQRGNWAEYFTPLALMALRTLGWKERPLAARRLAYLVAALAIESSRAAQATYLQSPASEGDRTDTH